MHSIEWLCCQWPWLTFNHLNLPQFVHFALPYASSLLMIAKTSNLLYRLSVQVTAYGRQHILDRGVVRSCNPFKNLRTPIIYHWNG